MIGVLHNDICLLNVSQDTHIALSGRTSLIDLSLVSLRLFRDCCEGQWFADRTEQAQLFAMHFGHSLVVPGIPFLPF